MNTPDRDAVMPGDWSRPGGLSLPAVAIDLETTGKAIVQVGLVLVLPDRVTRPVEVLVNPGDDALRAANPFGMAVHGIPAGRIRAEGLSPEVAAERLRRALATLRERHAPGGWLPLLAYGIAHEQKYLDAPPWQVTTVEGVCWGPCILALVKRHVPRDPSHGHKLAGASAWAARSRPGAAFQGGGAHQAGEDARVTGEVALALAALPELARPAGLPLFQSAPERPASGPLVEGPPPVPSDADPHVWLKTASKPVVPAEDVHPHPTAGPTIETTCETVWSDDHPELGHVYLRVPAGARGTLVEYGDRLPEPHNYGAEQMVRLAKTPQRCPVTPTRPYRVLQLSGSPVACDGWTRAILYCAE
jgi:DNA polymerase III epsilon subunit-like protein